LDPSASSDVGLSPTALGCHRRLASSGLKEKFHRRQAIMRLLGPMRGCTLFADFYFFLEWEKVCTPLSHRPPLRFRALRRSAGMGSSDWCPLSPRLSARIDSSSHFLRGRVDLRTARLQEARPDQLWRLPRDPSKRSPEAVLSASRSSVPPTSRAGGDRRGWISSCAPEGGLWNPCSWRLRDTLNALLR